jgi:hypothetical protein
MQQRLAIAVGAHWPAAFARRKKNTSLEAALVLTRAARKLLATALQRRLCV